MHYYLEAPTGDGQLNLARDEYLLNQLGKGDIALYLYVNSGAVIIGRNQNPYAECALSRMDEDGVQLVRRVSGGGAVYHDDGNLNYSFICHRDIYDEARQTSVIVSALKGFGISCEVSGRNDMTADGHKFSGNAFCGRGEIRQHHGTLLISSDLSVFDRYLTAPKQKLEAKGVKSVRARICNLNAFSPEITVEGMKKALRTAFEREYGAAADYIGFDAAELDKLTKKHRSFEWRLGETPCFDYAIEHKFPWGMTQLCFSVSGGEVTEARLYTDSLDITLSERTQALLTGLRFDKNTLSAALLEGDAAQRDMAEFILSQPIG